MDCIPIRYSPLAVRVLGFPYYAAADAFVIPTLEDNWSLVVPEAMACGLPILCSKYNGCWPELVQEGRNGWVFDPLDEQGTTETLSTAVRCQPELATMGAESLAIVSEHSPRRAAQAILSACELALEGSKPTHRQYCSCST